MLQIYRASAGSGKTHILTQEYLKLIFEHPNRFVNVLAVTFTNKAAEEMKDRIINELVKMVREGERSSHLLEIQKIFPHFSFTDIRKKAQIILDNILHDYSKFAVGTIDSFVQKVVRSFSFEIGIPTGYRIELNERKVINELTDEMYKKVSENKELLKWLILFAKDKLSEGKSWDTKNEIRKLASEIFTENFQTFYSKRDNFDIQSKNKMFEMRVKLLEIKNHFEEKMKQIAKKSSQILNDIIFSPKELGRNFEILANYLTKKLLNKEFEPNKTVYKCNEGIENWCAKSAKKEIRSAIDGIFPALSPLLNEAITIYETEYENYLSAKHTLTNFYCFGILHDIASLLPEYRQENNLLLITDTTRLLREIIAENEAPFIYEKIGTLFHHILIDEFQDTSNFQWHNFKPLIANSLAYGNKNLIVGDVKQSIYRWRGGDWKLLLEQVAKDIGENMILSKSLDTNWRSEKNIIDVNNSLFRFAPEILQNEYNKDLEEVLDINEKAELRKEKYDKILVDAYNDSFQKPSPKAEKAGGRVKIQFFSVENRTEMSNKWREKVSQELPETIDFLLKNKNYSPKDITILVRRNRDGREIIDLLLNFLNQHPQAFQYDIISAESLYLTHSSAVKLLLSAMKYINDNRDLMSLITLIYEFYKLKNESLANIDLHQLFFTENKTDRENLKNFLPAEFVENIDSWKKFPLYELTEKCISIFSLTEIKSEYPYLRTFQDAVLSFEKTYISNIDDFLQWWDEEGKNLSLQLSDKQEAIKVMTIHKAKGLAFRVVLIPYADWKLDHNPILAPIIWSKPQREPFNAFSFLPIYYRSELTKTIYNKDYLNEKLYAFMDGLNMLYVALTRPISELIIFAPTDKKRETISNIADVLWHSIASSTTNFSENKKNYVALFPHFNHENFIFEIKDGYNEKDEKLDSDEKIAEHIFEVETYPHCEWRDKIALKSNFENLFEKKTDETENFFVE